MDALLTPRLELRIGVTGHRPPRLKAEQVGQIREKAIQIFSLIKAQVADLHRRNPGAFASDPPRVVLVSPLATGGDTIAAEAALDCGVDLEACLPFSQDIYRKDFSAAEAETFERLLSSCKRIMELPGDSMPRNEAFMAVGDITMAQCDILLAIWDGQPAAGSGGTPEVIAESVAQHLPVVLIDAGKAAPPQLLWCSSDDEPHDMPSIETISSHDALSRMGALLEVLILPSSEQKSGRMSWIETKSRPPRRSIAYPLLQAITGSKSWASAFARPDIAGSAAQIDELTKAFAPGTPDNRRVANVMRVRFSAADHAANQFGVRYRSSYIFNFLMALLAIFLALSTLLFPSLRLQLGTAELFVILAIIIHTRRAGKAGWHRSWIDNRLVAEQLRVLALSASLGDLVMRRHRERIQSLGMADWYGQATAREIGMPPIALTEDRVRMIRDAALGLITEQHDYHVRNGKVMHRMDHWLHRTGEMVFMTTLLACIAALAAKFILSPDAQLAGFPLPALITVVTTFLPALGASLYSIRMQGDFKVAEERSVAIARQLARLQKAIHRDPFDFRRLTDRLRRLSEIILMESDQWRLLSEVRSVELPG